MNPRPGIVPTWRDVAKVAGIVAAVLGAGIFIVWFWVSFG